jgi:hypothetical protein
MKLLVSGKSLVMSKDFLLFSRLGSGNFLIVLRVCCYFRLVMSLLCGILGSFKLDFFELSLLCNFFFRFGESCLI